MPDESNASGLTEAAQMRIAAITTTLKAFGYPEEIEDAVMNMMIQHELGVMQ